MISKKALDDLVDEYTRAREHVSTAAEILEDASILAVDAIGQFGPFSSNGVITIVNETYAVINAAINRLRNVTPTD